MTQLDLSGVEAEIDALIRSGNLKALRSLESDLQAAVDRREADERQRRWQRDPLGAIGFEPVCKPRVLQRLAGVPEHELPPMCGTCPQERFMALPDENLDVLFGGAGGGGKSQSLLAMAIRTCIRFPGIQVFWFRKTFPQINQSVLRSLARYGYGKAVGARWNASKYELTFPLPDGTSILTFVHAKNMEEAAALSSAEINLLIIDERTTMPPDVVDFLYTRVRSGVQGVPCLGARSASNPGHVGHAVVKKGYVDATDRGTREIVDKAGRRRIFIPAKATDNPYVGDYDKTLDGIADPELRARIKEGDWSAMPDAAFPDWKPDRILVPAFTLPASWTRYGGLDYGWAAPSVYLAAARDGDGRLWFHRELTMRQTPEREQARRILESRNGEPVAVTAADPAMWGKVGSALPPAEQMAIEGLALTRGDNDRLGGKSRMHTYLAEAPACPHHRALGWDTCPMLHVLDGSCPELVQTMGDLPRDPKRPEDVDTDAPDHWYDSCLIAGTLIATSRGDVPIEEIHIGDLVMTRKGWRKVRDCGLTGIAKPVLTVHMSDGRTLTGTGNHPVFAAGRGFVRLDTLRRLDIIQECQSVASPSNQSSSTESPSADIPNRPTGRIASTTGRVRSIVGAAWGAFTRRSGKRLTGRYPKVTTSTIGTTIRTTTSSTTSFACPSLDTTPTTAPSLRARQDGPRGKRTGNSPPRGMEATRAALGMSSMADGFGCNANRDDSNALTAEAHSRRSTATRRPGSARANAARTRARRAVWTTKTASARAADRRSESTGTREPSAAPVSVLGLCDAGRADVYNLSVEDAEEYFANDVLVHNCRYLIMAVGGGAKFHFPAPQKNPEGIDPQAQPAQPQFTAPPAPPASYGGFPVAAGFGISPWA